MTNKDICIALERLRQKDFTDFEAFYDFLGALCSKYLNSQSAKGHNALMGKDDLRNSFYEVLVTQNTLGWKSSSNLQREINRLYIRETSYASNKLWQTVSNAVNKLVKKSHCQKSLDFRNLNNKNETVVYLSGCSNNSFDFNDFSEKCKAINTSKDLPPSIAEKLVAAIIEAAAAPITIGKINEIVRNKTLLYQEKAMEEKSTDGDSYFVHEGKEFAQEENDKEQQRLETLDIRIRKEAENRSNLIWKELGQLDCNAGDGKRIPGQNILCLYYLPKKIFQKQIRLEDLGVSQRIKEGGDQIQNIIRDFMNDAGFNNAVILEVFKFIIPNLTQLCSENGLGEYLNMAETN